ncbi:MAG: DUF2272 domain-containing protein [Alphaproteobacteria bacterium]|nr:DUF2272 domain-containing protein [Alphaproteobacteria bacterium]
MSMFADKLVAKATQEYDTYRNVLENRSPLKERIGAYWVFLGRSDLDGGDDVPWSAAFVSFMVNLAGAGAQFPYNSQHSAYFYRTINDKLTRRSRPFLGYRPQEIAIAPGDILGMNRGSSPPIDYGWAAHHDDYSSHADIVVDVAADGTIHTIGGNVGRAPGEIGRKTFSLVSGAPVNDANANQQAFVVIRSFLP